MTDNPFTNAHAHQDDDGAWCVKSSHWIIPAKDEASAHRMVELLASAYWCGQRDKANEIRAALGFPEIQDDW